MDFTDQVWTWVWILEVKCEIGYWKITVFWSEMSLHSKHFLGYSACLKYCRITVSLALDTSKTAQFIIYSLIPSFLPSFLS